VDFQDNPSYVSHEVVEVGRGRYDPGQIGVGQANVAVADKGALAGSVKVAASQE